MRLVQRKFISRRFHWISAEYAIRSAGRNGYDHGESDQRKLDLYLIAVDVWHLDESERDRRNLHGPDDGQRTDDRHDYRHIHG